MGRQKPLHEVAVEFLDHAERRGYRPRYVQSLRQLITKFSEQHAGMAMSEVNLNHLEAFITGAPATRKGNIGRLASMFAWARRRGWIQDNPVERLDIPRLESKVPTILTVDQCRAALTWTRANRPDALSFLAIALFAGVRPQETERVGWADIRDGKLHVSAAASKTRHRRIVTLPDTCRAWLALDVLRARLPMSNIGRRRYLKRLRGALGLDSWPQDVLRHTAASHLAARFGYRVAAETLGHSEAMLHRHYRELVTAEENNAFWSLLPDSKCTPNL